MLTKINKPDIILDRDGVINIDSDSYVKSVNEWLPIQSSILAIANLHKAGHRIFIATNQSGLGRGYFSLDTLTAMHNKMLDLIHQAGGEITGIAFCPHTPDDHCTCRKPKPGLLHDLSLKFNIDLNTAIVIGDSLRDLQAATEVGSKAILVLTGKGKKTQQENPELPYPIFETLYDASQNILI
ncbi:MULTISPECIES: D-glycero-beta-D-manno-heptose 1,7-bisphosphate 7-phosphatase [Cycloclasticus]|jgi:D-glycero-D-manno-heptose 1,7-bisphosphate phosphatase|uniref:D,D-heptose 1,7-bisphosphate phosphatase n=1 Tax=Cycloclasticus pugetii TaxID=34068 RepID=A0AB33Z165_9GAMM|nr:MULTISPECIES: D-glycero-beta-D-manno-heptose 1,7-bisphosphate 7-phosphatase [Cycloclasticus]AFT66061.1 Histidinol-phosphatase [Cycloclasticus sp. P1]ATI02162.1 D-glycero-beta-D-manno-heptose 1,7-bisphosphate 7-phosphatase [Cycloclasticus sp. PY97N]EPD13085.1 D,D-heptose 1,7-bisphosphate phosphatase [Cycloclasticus pugetii]